jgi:hypothetical protein
MKERALGSTVNALGGCGRVPAERSYETNPMRQLANFASALSLLCLGVASCGDNAAPGGNFSFAKFDMLCDFETSTNLNPDPRWNGSFAPDMDKSDLGSATKAATAERKDLSPPHYNPDSKKDSTSALLAVAQGNNVLWGTAWYTYFRTSIEPVDLSEYTGILLWARADVEDGQPVPTVKVAVPDYGSVALGVNNPNYLCDMNDNTVGGKGCFDDYSMKIYPDGQWRRYDLPFSQMTNGGWGLRHEFDPKRLYGIKFGMLPGVAYSIWIDDIALYRK